VLKKNGKQATGKSRGGWNTKIHVLSVKDTLLKGFILSGGEEHDAPAGRLLLETFGRRESGVPVLTDRAYADFKTRFTARSPRFIAVVPPKSNTAYQRDYDKELYKKTQRGGTLLPQA